jgi:hypothetical protein
MRYAIATLASLALGLQVGSGIVTVAPQPAQERRLLFLRHERVYAARADGSEVTGPLALGGAVYCLAVSPDARYLAVIGRSERGLRISEHVPFVVEGGDGGS